MSGANTYTGPTTINAGGLEVDGSVTSDITVNAGGTLGWDPAQLRQSPSVAEEPLHRAVISRFMLMAILAGHRCYSEGRSCDADPAGAGQIEITGNATLDGTLEVRFLDGFVPLNGQVFRLFHVGGELSGDFAQIIFPDLRSGFQFRNEIVDGYYQITALSDGTPAAGLLNISTRLQVGTDDNALIAGFIVTGSASKRVILRAIGPSLTVGGEGLADPMLELRDNTGALLLSNDNWIESPQMQEIIDSGIPPNDDHEAAIVSNLAPGSYTAIMRGVNNTTGIGVVEGYDLTRDAPAKLANISTRGFVDLGDNVMIGGFIADNQATHVMVRALGPSLWQSGISNALPDPTLELHDSQGGLVAFNNNWVESTDYVAIEESGIAPPLNTESAILTTLLPGAYTAVVRGDYDTTGVGLIEVYNLQ